nr:PREDICTED: dentin sialophosphoprotein-like [Bemisia tabaci]
MVTVQIKRILPLLSFFALANDLTSAAGPTVPDFDVMAHVAKISQMVSSGNVTELFAPGSELYNLSLAFLEKSNAYVKSLQKGDTELISNQSQPINSTDSSNGTQVSNQSDSSPNSSAEMGLDLVGFSERFPPDIMNFSLNGSMIGLDLTNMTGLADYIDNMFGLNNPDLQALNWSISDSELNFTNSFDQEGLDGINTSDFEPVITNQGGLSNLTNQGGPSNLTTGDLLLESDDADFSSKELPGDETSSLDASQFNNTSLVGPVGSSDGTPENGDDLSSQGSPANKTALLDGSQFNNTSLVGPVGSSGGTPENGDDLSSQGSPANKTALLDGSQFNTSLVDPVGSSGGTPENGTDLSSQGSPRKETGSLDGSPLNNVTSADQDDALSGPPGEPLAQLNGTGSSDQ